MSEIDEIKQRLSLLEIVSEVVTMKPAGRERYAGLCPFHDERSPSFHVVTDKGFFYCFGCQAKGDMFEFVQRTRGVEFVEALQMLGERAGVEVNTGSTERAAIASGVHAVNKLAMQHYKEALAENKAARQYLLDRGLTQKMIEHFNLGYARDSWDDLSVSLRDSAKVDDIARAGLTAESGGGRVYDRFRNRIMFPITDVTGRVVGFSGRALTDDGPKYLNTPETSVFDKSSLLYGLEQARTSIRTSNICIVVEGQMDVIALHQAGFTNATGVLGSSLTKEHASILQRLDVETLYLAFDSDSAGQKATLSGLDKTLGRNFLVKAVVLPAGTDPADLVLEDHRDAFVNALDNAVSEVNYRFDAAIAKHNLETAHGKKELLNELLPVLKPRDVFDPVASEMRRLVISHFKMDASRLDAWLDRQRSPLTEEQAKGLTETPTYSRITQIMIDIIALIMSDKAALPDRCEWLEPLIPSQEETEIINTFFNSAIFSSFNYDTIFDALKKYDGSEVIYERLARQINTEVPPRIIDKRLSDAASRLRELLVSESTTTETHDEALKRINDTLSNPNLPEEEEQACYQELQTLLSRFAMRDAERQNRLVTTHE